MAGTMNVVDRRRKVKTLGCTHQTEEQICCHWGLSIGISGLGFSWRFPSPLMDSMHKRIGRMLVRAASNLEV